MDDVVKLNIFLTDLGPFTKGQPKSWQPIFTSLTRRAPQSAWASLPRGALVERQMG